MTTGYWDLPGSLYTGCFWFDAAFSSSFSSSLLLFIYLFI